MFYSISFAMYCEESILLSSYVVWWNDLLIYKMLFDRFRLPEALVTPADTYKGIYLPAEFFPTSWVIWLHPYRRIAECLAIIKSTFHLQDRRSAWNPLFSIIAQID